ncbi:MAG: hypothetical protein QRY72_00705 [Candidatus Rhabdochlamydia sp.]
MSMTTKVLTQAGLIKMPLWASHSSKKIRLYAFLNQELEDIKKNYKHIQ